MIVLLLGLLAMTWWRLQPKDEEIRHSRLLMGTVVEIMAGGQEADQMETAVEAAFAEITRLDLLLSNYQESSDISLLSQSTTGCDVKAETAEVIALGLDVTQRSGGAFDMTLGRLKALWGIESEHPAVPDQQEIFAALTGIGPGSLAMDGRYVIKKQAQLLIDLGGIAKGYAVDRAISVLKQHNIQRAAVNAGGDMYLLGQRSERPWRIGIQHPRHKEAVLETVEVSNRAVVTSGDYERFFEQDGQRYHHIFDPRTGFPARSCQSVTIISDSVALGDALATAVFVLGPQAGLVLLAKYPGTEGLIVSADGTLYHSPGWANYKAAP
jgi:thiamine biosynthesis lipoprotein